MKMLVLFGLVLALFTAAHATDVFFSDYRHAILAKKGLTFSATVYPE